MSRERLQDIATRARSRRQGLERRREVMTRPARATRTGGPESSASDVPELRRFFARGRFSEADPFDTDPGHELEIKGRWKSLYDQINQHVNSTIFEHDAIFLNYGFLDDGSPRASRIELPEQYPNRNCVELLLELVGDAELGDRDVLDVGCGRGGNAKTMVHFFAPRQVVGLDQSFAAVNFCNRSWAGERLAFVEGDAERLPFADGSFDFVTNFESSCCYPSWPSFLRQVHRVLRPGGAFLHTDLFPNDTLPEMLDFLAGLGFAIERDQDITHNVLKSCDEAAKRVAQVYKDYLDETVQAHFVGVPGTTPYDEMVDGTMSYRIFRLRKPEA